MSLTSSYKVITVTHHNINVNEIGHFYINIKGVEDRIDTGIALLKSKFNIQECQYLETCNRVAYIFYGDVTLDDAFLEAFFKTVNPGLEAKTLKSIAKFVSTYEGTEAIRHVFELASSMDSLVVGEREIFRQYRNAYNKCRQMGHISDNLRMLENATVGTAKAVYHSTKIGEKPLSIVSLSMSALLKKQLKSTSKVLLVGAGETNSLVAKFLKKYDFSDIKIYNRSLNNAKELSDEIGATSYNIDELAQVDAQFDIIIICTSANRVVIDEKLYEQMVASDQGEKVIIDLAVPRNVSAGVVDNYNVHYIDIESLKKISEANLEFRKQEVEKARPIIKHRIQSFKNLYRNRLLERALSKVPTEINKVKDRALNNVYKQRIEELDPSSQALLLEMMDYMEKKCIAVPIKLARAEVDA